MTKLSTLIIIVIIIIVGGYFLVTRGDGDISMKMLKENLVANIGEVVNVDNDPVQISMLTSKGTIELELLPQVAPKTVTNFATLVSNGFYNGVKFHRVINDFMIQGGDPLSKKLEEGNPNIGTGGPGYFFEDEINVKGLGVAENIITQLEQAGYVYDDDLKSIPMDIGVIAMANSGPNTNGSQFFIVKSFENTQHLNGLHTVFGKVMSGMDIVNSIEQNDVIESVTLK